MIIWYSLIIFDVDITNYIHGRIYNSCEKRNCQNHSISGKQTNFFYKISCRQGIYLENRHTCYKLFLNRGYSFHNNCSLTSSLDNNWFFVLTEFEPQISYLTANYKLIDQFFSFFYQILRRKKNNNKDSLKIYYK